MLEDANQPLNEETSKPIEVPSSIQVPEVLLSTPSENNNSNLASQTGRHFRRDSERRQHSLTSFPEKETNSSSQQYLSLTDDNAQKSSSLILLSETGYSSSKYRRSASDRRKVYSSDKTNGKYGAIPKRPVSFREFSSRRDDHHLKRSVAKSASSDSCKSATVTFSLPGEFLQVNDNHEPESRRASANLHPRLTRQPTGPAIKRTNTGVNGSQSSSSAFSSSTDVQTLLTYTKGLLIVAYFVFLCGSGITLNELISFLIDPDNSVSSQREDSKWIAGVVLLFLASISLLGLYGALKEESCILLLYGSLILIIFVIHVVLLFHLKNACSQTQKKCYRNMATPPGLAPILVAISELVIAMCAFFMVLIIESERKASANNPVCNQKQPQSHNIINTVADSVAENITQQP